MPPALQPRPDGPTAEAVQAALLERDRIEVPILDFNGVPFLLIPRSKAEIGAGSRFELTAVNQNEAALNPCRKLVLKRGGQWQLSNAGTELLDLLAF